MAKQGLPQSAHMFSCRAPFLKFLSKRSATAASLQSNAPRAPLPTIETARFTPHRDTGMIIRLSALIALTFGLVVSANFSLAPSQSNSLRLLDVFTLLCVPAYLISLIRRPLSYQSALAMTLFGITITLVTWQTLASENNAMIPAFGRLVLAVIAAALLVPYFHTRKCLHLFFIGLFLGGLVNVVITLGQRAEMPFFEMFKHIDAQKFWIMGGVRAAGIWVHPNDNMQVTVLSAAACLIFLPSRPQALILWPVIVFLGMIMTAYLGNFSRAGLVVGGFMALVTTLNRANAYGKFLAIFGVLCLVNVLIFAPDLVFGERFEKSGEGQTVFDQIDERLLSTLVGAGLAVEFPLGVPSELRATLMGTRAGIGASHNGFVCLLINLGIFAGSALLCCAFWAFIAALRGRSQRPYHYMLGCIFLMFMFEDAAFLLPIMATVAVIFFAILVEGREDRSIRMARPHYGARPSPIAP